MIPPLVSVLVTTYNHGRFIAQTLDSILMQQTTFRVEILVGEDCSTDDTAAIVQTYQARYPDRIRAFISPHNEGGHANFSRLLEHAQGQYLAWVEGDDYWIDPKKLEKQVAFLAQHPDVALCFHAVEIIEQGSAETASASKVTISNAGQAPETTMARLCLGNYIRTASSMVRRGVVTTLPEWIYPLPLGDWPFFLLHAQTGKIGFLPDVMAAYRSHAQG
ncbi:MAG: glycosyltransferase, partial [Vampirovibrionales bacterium]|nr:glycosyltransferase [Vampirovibrionales bacterium]